MGRRTGKPVGRPKFDPVREGIKQAAARTGMTYYKAEAVAHSLAAADPRVAAPGQRFSMNQIAELYGLPLGKLLAFKNCKQMHVPLAELKDAMIAKRAVIADMAINEVAERLSDPEHVATLTTPELAKIGLGFDRAVHDLAHKDQPKVIDITPTQVVQMMELAKQAMDRPTLHAPKEE